MSDPGNEHRPRPLPDVASYRDGPSHGSPPRPGLSDLALRALRVAATLAAVAVDVRVRVGDGERTTVEVRRPPTPRDDGCVVVPPCYFRAAVGRANTQQAGGQPVEMAGLEGVCDPVIEIGLAPSDAALPGDIYRLSSGDEWTFLFGTTLRVDAAMACCGDLDEVLAVGCGEVGIGAQANEAPTNENRAVRIGFHHDEVTQITLVHTAVPELQFARAEQHLAALHTVLARCAVEELVAHLSP